MAAELHDRRLVVLVVQRQGEDDPQWWEDGEHRQERKYFCAAPVRDSAFPQLLKNMKSNQFELKLLHLVSGEFQNQEEAHFKIIYVYGCFIHKQAMRVRLGWDTRKHCNMIFQSVSALISRGRKRVKDKTNCVLLEVVML